MTSRTSCPPGGHVEETRHQGNQRTFSRSAGTYERENLSGFDLELDIVKHFPLHAFRFVTEADIFQLDFARERRKHNGARLLLDFVANLHELENLG